MSFRSRIRPLTIALVLCAALAATLFLPADEARASNGMDPAHFRLTPALLDRMNAVAAELQDTPEVDADDDEDEQDDDAAESVDDIARKLDAQPEVRAALARHQLSSQEYVSATFAALHAGMYLAMEKSADPQALASFTPEQRANIEAMRSYRTK